MSSVQDLISRSASLEGQQPCVAYDPTHHISYGYWICRTCSSSFFSGGEETHQPTCSSKGQVGDLSNRIYVLGDNENGIHSPFDKNQIDRIIAFAKSHFDRASAS